MGGSEFSLSRVEWGSGDINGEVGAVTAGVSDVRVVACLSCCIASSLSLSSCGKFAVEVIGGGTNGCMPIMLCKLVELVVLLKLEVGVVVFDFLRACSS